VRFSVYIPIRNEARWLPGAIDSVLAQTHQDWELIIGDNASEEDLASIAARYPDPRIHHVRWDRFVPITENHNRTMGLGRFEWLHLLSADDRILPRGLELIAARIQDTEGSVGRLAMVVGACRRVDEDGRPTDLMDGPVERPGIYQTMPDGLYDAEAWVRANAARGIRPWMFGGVAMNRELLNEIGGWRPEMGLNHDLELLVRIAAFGSVSYITEPVLAYTVRSDSQTALLTGQQMRRSGAMVETGHAWESILLAHARQRTISSGERSVVDAAIARAFLQRAVWHRERAGGHGRLGALRDVVRALRYSGRTVLGPKNLAVVAIVLIAPGKLISAIRKRAHQSGWVVV
jgi:Glycosyl transferase family 2